jgi:exonuclease SbcC
VKELKKEKIMRLDSITLNNIRRFGEDVEIKMGAGATILLAPNGTGKTTVFEGIELALTGGVRRLDGNISTIVGEGKKQASALLNFTEAISKVVVDENGEIHHEINDLDRLLQGTSQDQLPYLFRLTHLLDQHEGRWFVQADEKEAGKILGSVPIGKDANRVGDSLASTNLAFIAILKSEKERLAGVIEKRDNWLNILKDKNETLSGLSDSLEPVENIFKSIVEIEKNLDKEKKFEIISIPTAVACCAELRVILGRKNETVSSFKMSLGLAPTYIEQFDELKKQHAVLSESIGKLNNIKNEKYTNYQKSQSNLKEKREEHQAQAGRTLNAQNVLNTQKKLGTTRNVLAIKDEEYTKIQTKINDFNATNIEKQNELIRLNNIVSAHRLFGEREAMLRTKINGIAESRIQLIKWKNLELSLNRYNGEEPKLIEQLGVLERRLSDAISELSERDKTVSQLQIIYDGLNAVSGIVSGAVGVIADNLPKTSENCPVCNQFHGVEELQHRIANSVASIDPELADVKNRLDGIKEIWISAEKVVNSLIERKNELQDKLSELQACKNKITEEIDFLRSKDSFLSMGDIPLVESHIDEESKSFEESREKLVREVASADGVPSDENILELKEALRRVEIEILEAKNFEVEISSERDDLKKTLELIVDLEGIELTMEAAVTKLSSEETSLVNAKSVLVEAEILNNNYKEEYVKGGDDLTAEELKLQNNIESIEKCKAKWQAITLVNDPSVQILEDAVNQAEYDTKYFNTMEAKVTRLRSQLAGWESSESLDGILKEIDEKRGELSEAGQTDKLETDVQFHQRLIEDIQVKESTYKDFSGYLKVELEGVKEQINSVIPEWRALLKRIVRDERISQAGLSYIQKNQKGKAFVTLPINGKDTIANLVGSEAQMTDMQLSFLLTMAAKHPWCNWKGLLLDDPTQHHDMVHASAVFDVLRDYIVDRGFQVLLATHDAQQARFFMRKLENDGIDSRLLVLEPGEDGVRCKEV